MPQQLLLTACEQAERSETAVRAAALMHIARVLACSDEAAAVQGTAVDKLGAVVQGAMMTLREAHTNATATTLSSDLGLYIFLNVKPGLYEVSAEKPGFATARTPQILLDARQSRRAEFVLEIAPRSDTVVVSANVPAITTESGTVADSKGFEQITRLPLNYRASRNNTPLATISAVPGVQQDQQGRLSIGGGLPAQVEISVDGISSVPVYANMPLPNAPMAPSPEILGEFKVTSVDSTAEFGQMGDVTMVSRGGGNDWHGGAFWYHQNRALDATIYNAPVKQAKVFNTFGLNFSGPLELPGYRGRNRTFFFADYEGNRRPQSVLDQLSVPTAAARSGDLSNVPGGGAVDPLSGLPFPGNQIPASRINSVARKLFSDYYPLPTVPNADSGINYRHLTPVNDTLDGYDVRLDHVLTSTQHIFVRWSAKMETLLADHAPLPSDSFSNGFQNLVISHIGAPRPALSNEFRFGFAIWNSIERPAFRGKDAVANLGITGLDLSHAGDSGGFPGFYFDDGTEYTDIGAGRSANLQSRNFQFTDTLSLVRGQHSLKFGTDVRKVGYTSALHSGGYSDDFGAFEFNSGAYGGNAFADLLLGVPTYSYYAALGPNITETQTNAGVFAQDNWQVHPRLTIQLGLRWEVHPPFQESAGNIANFDHQTGDVIVPDDSLPPALSFLAAIHACSVTVTPPCTGVLTASQAGLPAGLRRIYFGNWNPRFGFAWQPLADRKTVVRGSIGRYTQSLLGSFAYSATGIASSDVRTFNNYQSPAGVPWFSLPAATPPLSSLGQIGTESFFDGTDPTMKDPRSWQWSFTIERELPLHSSFGASYVGVQSVGLPVRVDFNQLPASITPFSVSRQPFQQWASLTSLEGVGFANYQGVTLEWSHRLRNDFFFQTSYTLSKNIGETGTAPAKVFPPEYPSFFLTDRFDTRYDRGNLAGARRNRVVFSSFVPIPLGRGRPFGGTWHGFRQGVFGGWELSAIGLIQSGPYQTPTIAAGLDRSNTNIGNRAFARPDRVGNGNLPNPTRDQYYDPSAFVAVPKGAGRFGNAGAGILEGPGTAAVAAGLSKTVRLTEKLRLRTEATFTNLANHPNFLPPSVAVGTPSFGKLTSVQSAENAGNRTGQIAARLDF
jgi:hypothetical protein